MSSSIDHLGLDENHRVDGESKGGSTGTSSKVYCNAGPLPPAYLAVPKIGDWRDDYSYKRPESPRPYENTLFCHTGGYKPSMPPEPKPNVDTHTTTFQPSGSQVSKVLSTQDHPLDPDPPLGTSVDPAVATNTQTSRRQPFSAYISNTEVAGLRIDSNFDYGGITEGERRTRSRTNTKTGDV
jgi:hypothetical protein